MAHPRVLLDATNRAIPVHQRLFGAAEKLKEHKYREHIRRQELMAEIEDLRRQETDARQQEAHWCEVVQVRLCAHAMHMCIGVLCLPAVEITGHPAFLMTALSDCSNRMGDATSSASRP
jgi:hypothetical protein